MRAPARARRRQSPAGRKHASSWKRRPERGQARSEPSAISTNCKTRQPGRERASGMAKPAAGGRRPKRRERKNVAYGTAHIKSSFNNTIITYHRSAGEQHRLGVGGQRGLQGLAQVDAVRRGTRCGDGGAARDGARDAPVDVVVKGPGAGRETAMRAIQNTGIEGRIKDVTPIPHNGCRPPKRRRVVCMARYTGAVCKLCRRERMKLFLKGAKCDTMRCPVERKPYPPGQHGRGRIRTASTCSSCVRSRRPAASTACSRSSSAICTWRRRERDHGRNLLKMLELRLDNVGVPRRVLRGPQPGPPVRPP